MTYRTMMWICLAMMPVALIYNGIHDMWALGVLHAATFAVAALISRHHDQLDRRYADITRSQAEVGRYLGDLAAEAFRWLPLSRLVERHDHGEPHPAVAAALHAELDRRNFPCGCKEETP